MLPLHPAPWSAEVHSLRGWCDLRYFFLLTTESAGVPLGWLQLRAWFPFGRRGFARGHLGPHVYRQQYDTVYSVLSREARLRTDCGVSFQRDATSLHGMLFNTVIRCTILMAALCVLGTGRMQVLWPGRWFACCGSCVTKRRDGRPVDTSRN